MGLACTDFPPSIRQHGTSNSANRLGRDFHPGGNDGDRSIGHGYHGTCLQGEEHAGSHHQTQGCFQLCPPKPAKLFAITLIPTTEPMQNHKAAMLPFRQEKST